MLMMRQSAPDACSCRTESRMCFANGMSARQAWVRMRAIGQYDEADVNLELELGYSAPGDVLALARGGVRSKKHR